MKVEGRIDFKPYVRVYERKGLYFWQIRSKGFKTKYEAVMDARYILNRVQTLQFDAKDSQKLQMI